MIKIAVPTDAWKIVKGHPDLVRVRDDYKGAAHEVVEALDQAVEHLSPEI
jgi:glycerate kinase